MAYADQKMSSGKIGAIVIVVLLHAVLGYAFVTGLAMNVIKHVSQDLKTFDVEEPPPPPEEPPPPPPPDKQLEPPPVVSPPPIVSVQTVTTPPPVFTQPRPEPAPVPRPAPPPPPPAPVASKAAAPKGDPARWFSTDDYPPGALRREEQGTTVIAWDIDEAGRVTNCRVTQSSGSSELDEQTCKLMVRRGKYSPALDQSGNPMRVTGQSRRVRWQLPQN
jgi:protein TonB